MARPDPYQIDLRAVGIKDRELSKLLAEVERIDRRHTEAYAELEEARAARARANDEIDAEIEAAVLDGDDPPSASELLAEREDAFRSAERTYAGVRGALLKARWRVEGYLARHGTNLRAQVREALDKRRADAEAALDEAIAAVDHYTDGLAALAWCQGIPKQVGRGLGVPQDPARDRGQLVAKYDAHPSRSDVRQARRDLDEAPVPPEEWFHEAREVDPAGYLIEPLTGPRHKPGTHHRAGMPVPAHPAPLADRLRAQEAREVREREEAEAEAATDAAIEQAAQVDEEATT